MLQKNSFPNWLGGISLMSFCPFYSTYNWLLYFHYPYRALRVCLVGSSFYGNGLGATVYLEAGVCLLASMELG